MNQTNTGKTIIRLEVKELCNETKPPIDVQYNFPTLSDEYLEKAPPEEKMHLITNYLNQQKKSLTEYKRLEQRMLEKEHKKELFILKYNTVIFSFFYITKIRIFSVFIKVRWFP